MSLTLTMSPTIVLKNNNIKINHVSTIVLKDNKININHVSTIVLRDNNINMNHDLHYSSER